MRSVSIGHKIHIQTINMERLFGKFQTSFYLSSISFLVSARAEKQKKIKIMSKSAVPKPIFTSLKISCRRLSFDVCMDR